jgi:methionine--tRNA ligase beta chain
VAAFGLTRSVTSCPSGLRGRCELPDEAFLERYNADLANGLKRGFPGGPTVRERVRIDTPVPSDDNEIRKASVPAAAAYGEAFDRFEFSRGLDAVSQMLKGVDGYVASLQPWKIAREEGPGERLSRILYASAEGTRIAAAALAPVPPHAAPRALALLGADPSDGPGALGWGRLPVGRPLSPAEPLFPRVDPKQFFEETRPMSDNAPSTAAPAAAPRISIEDFQKIELRTARILAAAPVPKSKKLMRLEVDLGAERRQIVAGIATRYTAEQLVGKTVVVVANLQPARLMGLESDGMVLAASLPESGDGDPRSGGGRPAGNARDDLRLAGHVQMLRPLSGGSHRAGAPPDGAHPRSRNDPRRFPPAVEVAERTRDSTPPSDSTRTRRRTSTRTDLKVFEDLLRSAKAVAVGEIGLDFHDDHSPREDQLRAFRAQLAFADARALPVLLHNRESGAEMLEAIAARTRRPNPGVFHSFTESAEYGEQAIALGYRVSFSGMLTFKAAENIRAAARGLPLSAMLVETDAPYLAPEPHRGKRCEPAFVVETARRLASVKNVPFSEVEAATTANFDALFVAGSS